MAAVNERKKKKKKDRSKRRSPARRFLMLFRAQKVKPVEQRRAVYTRSRVNVHVNLKRIRNNPRSELRV